MSAFTAGPASTAARRRHAGRGRAPRPGASAPDRAFLRGCTATLVLGVALLVTAAAVGGALLYIVGCAVTMAALMAVLGAREDAARRD